MSSSDRFFTSVFTHARTRVSRTHTRTHTYPITPSKMKRTPHPVRLLPSPPPVATLKHSLLKKKPSSAAAAHSCAKDETKQRPVGRVRGRQGREGGEVGSPITSPHCPLPDLLEQVTEGWGWEERGPKSRKGYFSFSPSPSPSLSLSLSLSYSLILISFIVPSFFSSSSSSSSSSFFLDFYFFSLPIPPFFPFF